jgi:hypothetical protein
LGQFFGGFHEEGFVGHGEAISVVLQPGVNQRYIQFTAGEGGAFVDGAPLERPSAEDPGAFGLAFGGDDPRLPSGPTGRPVIGEQGDFGYPQLLGPLDKGDLRNAGGNPVERDDGR